MCFSPYLGVGGGGAPKGNLLVQFSSLGSSKMVIPLPSSRYLAEGNRIWADWALPRGGGGGPRVVWRAGSDASSPPPPSPVHMGTYVGMASALGGCGTALMAQGTGRGGGGGCGGGGRTPQTNVLVLTVYGTYLRCTRRR